MPTPFEDEGRRTVQDQGAELVDYLGQPEALFPRYANNARGATVSFRLPDGLERAVDRMVQIGRERGLPWEHRADLFRDAVAWFVSALARRFEWSDPFLVSLESRQRLEDRVEYMANLRAQAERSTKKLTDMMFNYIVHGETAQARTELSRYREEVARMTERFIRHQYETAMLNNQRFQEVQQALENAREDSE